MKNKYLQIVFTISTIAFSLAFAFQQPVARDVYNPFQKNYNVESDRVVNMVDEKGKTIHKTALTVYVGDEFIAQDNKRYRVTRIKGNTAYAKFMGVENIKWDPKEGNPTSYNDNTMVTKAAKGQKIAIYHTHSDESYVPTDGSPSISARGGIYKVGTSFADRLKAQGFTVVQSLRPHDPHDANAYSRSRRTATELITGRPNALFDVHRDATPPEVYKRNIAGKDVTGVKLVVGRQNPKMSANLAFAKRLKAASDKLHPGLVTGIFMAKGDYNQDLGNRAMLIEVGSHTNSRAEAEKGVALLADAMPMALKGTGTMAQVGPANFSPTASESTGVFRAVLWVLGLAIVGGALFLWIATGSIKASVEKLKQFKNVEFANYFGPKPKDKKDNDKGDADRK